MTPHARWRAAVALVLLAGCQPAAPEPPLHGGLLAGCLAVFGDRCEALPGAELLAFLQVPRGSTPRGTVDGHPWPLVVEARGRGLLLHLEVPQEGGRARIFSDTGTQSAGLEFVLSIRTSTTPEDPARRVVLQAWSAARQQLRGGDPAGAVAALDRLAAEGLALEPVVARRARLLAAQVQAVRLGDPAAGLVELQRVPWPGPLEADGRVDVWFHRAVVARAAGRGREAAEDYATGAALAEEFGSPLTPLFRQGQALSLIDTARAEAGTEVLLELVATATRSPPCWRADFLSNAAWGALRSERYLDRAPELLARAEALYQGDCADPILANNVRVNRALLAERRGAPNDARAALAGVTADEDPEVALWRRALQVRLSGAADPRAEAELSAIALEAELRGVPEVVWQAHLEQGRRAKAAKRWSAARQAFMAAERSLAQEVARQPLSAGRLAILEDRSASAEELIGLLLARGEVAEAFRAARRARRRGLTELLGRRDPDRLQGETAARWAAARAEYGRTQAAVARVLALGWQAPGEDRPRRRAELEGLVELRRAAAERALAVLGRDPEAAGLAPVGRGEVWLLFRERGQGGTLFIATAERVRAVDLRSDEAEPVIAAARPELERAKRVIVLSTGAPGAWTWHLAELNGTPLGATRVVAHGLDLAPLASEPRPTSSPGRARVVADPRGDLAQARAEGSWVSQALAEADWSVEPLFAASARAERVLDGLGDLELLHYAGHGLYAGEEGGESLLALADRGLSTAEILLLSGAPRWVVLSACEAGRSPDRAQVAGLGLAQAFLAAGSEAVVAAPQPVPDVVAPEFTRRLYHSAAAGITLEERYRRALADPTLPPEARRFLLLVR